MRTILICPAERPGVAALARSMPLVNVPICGAAVIEHWLEYLANQGERKVLILASDRPEQVRALVGDGKRWGLCATVQAEASELSESQAREKYSSTSPTDNVVTMDYLPGSAEMQLYTSYAAWFAAVLALLPRAATPARIGLRVMQPGVWVGLHCRISSQARLLPPCWIGEHVRIDADAVVGPGTVVEDGAWLEPGAEVKESVVGPHTLVGQCTELCHSIAWGSALVDWKSGSTVDVTDEFLLSSLHQPSGNPWRTSLFGRIAALAMLALTAPFVAGWLAAAFSRGRSGLCRRVAVRPWSGDAVGAVTTIPYFELSARYWLWRRWPQLWNVAMGDFAWVGNRPLKPAQANLLSNEFERLWLHAPIGLFSLADAEGCMRPFCDEARAHASFYAAQPSRLLNVLILLKALFARRRRRPALHNVSAGLENLFAIALRPADAVRPLARRPSCRRCREFALERSGSWPREVRSG